MRPSQPPAEVAAREGTGSVGSAGPGRCLLLALGLVVVLAAAAAAGERGGLEGRDREELLGYARDTWRSVAEMADGTPLPVDGLRHLPNGTWKPSPKTTPTDIGAYLWSVLAAERLGIIDAGESRRRLGRTLRALERSPRVHGFLFDDLDPPRGTG